MKIYVGCAIGNLPQKEWAELFAKVTTLKAELTKRGHTVLDFQSDAKRQAEKGTVFVWDYKQCMECDAMVAVALHPSTGMGMEIAFCLSKPKPAIVLAVAPKGNNTSRMITECNLPTFKYQEFDAWEEIPDMFKGVCGEFGMK